MLTIFRPIEDQLAALREPYVPDPPSPWVREALAVLRAHEDDAPATVPARLPESEAATPCRWCGRLYADARGLYEHLSASADCRWVHETLDGR